MFDSASGYGALKNIIKTRHDELLVECRDHDTAEKIFRAQGAAREFQNLLDKIAEMEHEPEKNG